MAFATSNVKVAAAGQEGNALAMERDDLRPPAPIQNAAVIARARRKQRVSMADVARLAGVSSQTVSRVSNGHPNVVGSTREQVLAAMRQLGYRPNSAARALKYGEFRTIGVILFSLTSTGNSRTLEAIADHAAREGYAITLIPIAVPTQDHVLGAFTRLGELAVDAVIVIMEIHLLDTATVTLPPGAHVVVVDSDAGDRYSVVDTDQTDGARQVYMLAADMGGMGFIENNKALCMLSVLINTHLLMASRDAGR